MGKKDLFIQELKEAFEVSEIEVIKVKYFGYIDYHFRFIKNAKKVDICTNAKCEELSFNVNGLNDANVSFHFIANPFGTSKELYDYLKGWYKLA